MVWRMQVCAGAQDGKIEDLVVPVSESHMGGLGGQGQSAAAKPNLTNPTALELWAEAEVGANAFNSQEIPRTNMFISISDHLPVLVVAVPGRL